ncbi:MAG: hypothetical protein IAE77_03035 [Prosthecobacter sp.]|jgi:hypothetical protein|uniref:hypothetical protein n=1 Tax=Prosthecobacter sp. TaxID=1965333 RepID=UPI0019F9D749|nr:hypothetical protein [Prosthecobacter sp.]MBE2282419.1 hypothetical protein [Prosthecobacter sp.]
MRPNQLLKAIGPELRLQIMTYMQNDQRAAYKAVVESLASARRLRPTFVLEKSRVKQAEWLLEQLATKSNEEVTAQIFQIWLLKGQPQMLITFLDAAQIAHDGKGEVTELPEVIDDDKAEAAVSALLAAYPASHAALYLYMFQEQRPGGWASITKAIEARPELKLAA